MYNVRDFPPGALITIHRGLVGSDLYDFGVRAALPPGTFPVLPKGSSLAKQRNMGVHEAFSGQYPCEWVCFIDSDQVLPNPYAICQLLAHNVDVVGANICRSTNPYNITAFTNILTEPYELVDPGKLPLNGLVPLPQGGTGTGCLLVRKAVFDTVDPPWFRSGQIDPEEHQEDIFFMRSVIKAGYTPYLDAGLRLGHRFAGTVWPGVDGRPWLQVDGPDDIRFPYPVR